MCEYATLVTYANYSTYNELQCNQVNLFTYSNTLIHTRKIKYKMKIFKFPNQINVNNIYKTVRNVKTASKI